MTRHASPPSRCQAASNKGLGLPRPFSFWKVESDPYVPQRAMRNRSSRSAHRSPALSDPGRVARMRHFWSSLIAIDFDKWPRSLQRVTRSGSMIATATSQLRLAGPSEIHWDARRLPLDVLGLVRHHLGDKSQRDTAEPVHDFVWANALTGTSLSGCQGYCIRRVRSGKPTRRYQCQDTATSTVRALLGHLRDPVRVTAVLSRAAERAKHSCSALLFAYPSSWPRSPMSGGRGCRDGDLALHSDPDRVTTQGMEGSI